MRTERIGSSVVNLSCHFSVLCDERDCVQSSDSIAQREKLIFLPISWPYIARLVKMRKQFYAIW